MAVVAHADPRCPLLRSGVLCPPQGSRGAGGTRLVAKGHGLMPFLYLSITCSHKFREFVFPSITLLSHVVSGAKGSGLVLMLLLLPPKSSLQGDSSLGSRSIPRASRETLHVQLGAANFLSSPAGRQRRSQHGSWLPLQLRA